MAADGCVFCKIVEGKIPSLRILETAGALAFLDIGPLAPGHCLLIPKHHYKSMLDIPEDELAALVRHLPRLARAVVDATGASGLNILQNTGESSGQAVFHMHFHLIPRIDGDRLGYRWNAGAYQGNDGEQMRRRIVESVGHP